MDFPDSACELSHPHNKLAYGHYFHMAYRHLISRNRAKPYQTLFWMNSTEVQSPQCKLDDKCLCLSHVFVSVLACAKSAHMFQKLSYSLCGPSLVSNSSSSDTKAFLSFIAFSGFPTAVHRPLHALRYYTVGIPFWTTRKRWSQMSKFDRKTTIPCAQVTWSHITVTYMLRKNIRKHCMWRKWLT